MTWLTWPNRITLARILLIAPFVICVLQISAGGTKWRHAALALFVLMAISDVLDGFLARRLNQETPLGRFLDPVADKLLIVSTVVLLCNEATAVPGFRIPSWVAVIAVGKDILTVTGFLVLFTVTGKLHIKPRIWGKLCTLLQLLMVAAALLAPDLPALVGGGLPSLWLAASALAVIAILDYVRIGGQFAAEDAHQDGSENET